MWIVMRQKVSLGVSKFWYAYCQSLVRTYWLQSVSTRLSFFTAVFSTNTYWYNLANIQDAITLFFSQILEFCMWSDNQEELMKESKVWNILKNANKKKSDDFMWPIYYGLGKYGTNKIQKSLATEINLRETELFYNGWKSILKKISCFSKLITILAAIRFALRGLDFNLFLLISASPIFEPLFKLRRITRQFVKVQVLID